MLRPKEKQNKFFKLQNFFCSVFYSKLYIVSFWFGYMWAADDNGNLDWSIRLKDWLKLNESMISVLLAKYQQTVA